jgi:Asp-tRNA(Asn)/Glu-tRNA(Gln) amidotransferase A subunit family amidase
MQLARDADVALQRHKLLGVDEPDADGLGVLHGIPVVVKDCIDTDARYGMPTSAGNFALGETRQIRSVPSAHAHLAKSLDGRY